MRRGRVGRPGSPRTIASTSAKNNTRISAITINLMFVWKPSHTCGTARRKPSGLKKECRNLPISASAALTTPLLQDRNARERQPLRLQPLDRSVRLERIDRAVQRGLQLAALVHDRAVAL